MFNVPKLYKLLIINSFPNVCENVNNFLAYQCLLININLLFPVKLYIYKMIYQVTQSKKKKKIKVPKFFFFWI